MGNVIRDTDIIIGQYDNCTAVDSVDSVHPPISLASTDHALHNCVHKELRAKHN